MDINEFIHINKIRPADAIIVKKRLFGMLNHYVIYMGVHYGKHKFVANYTEGINVLSEAEINQFMEAMVPTHIEYFNGSKREQRSALKRAWSRVGERDYNLLKNNCEHYKNYVHHGHEHSEQAENFKAGAGLVLLGLGAAALIGLFGAMLGNGEDEEEI